MTEKIGRNDPCWCGSGAKYKKCHLGSDEAEARKDRDLQREAEALRDPVAEKLAGEILQGTERWHTREDFDRARENYFDSDPREKTSDPDREDGFLEWYMRDFRPISTGRTPIEEYLAEAGPGLPSREREMVEAWRDGKYSLGEVERVDVGASVSIRDLLDGTEYFVSDPLISKQVRQWDCFLSRFDYLDGHWMLGGDTITLPRIAARRILKTMDDFANLRAFSHELHRKVEELTNDWAGDVEVAEMDGDLGEDLSTELVCSDEATVLAEFRKTPELAEIESSFAWRGNNGQTLGILTFVDGRLRLTCQSSTRLEILREMVEHLVGDYLAEATV